MDNLGNDIKFREAESHDCIELFNWRNHPNARKGSFNTKYISLAEHKKWFYSKIEDPNTEIYIAKFARDKIGAIRFEIDNSFVRVSVNLNPDFFGKGWGAQIIKLGTERFVNKTKLNKPIIAEIKKDNSISQKAFLKAAYKFSSEKEEKVIHRFINLDQLHYKFKIDKDSDEILLNMPEGVFLPTGTTAALLEAIRTYVAKPGKLLDLGCGSGVVGITLHRAGLAKAPFYASDVSEQAIDCVNKNAAFHLCPVITKCGSLFDPWKNEKFDYIVNDISGVATEAAKCSPWFNNVPCDSGVDGTLLVVNALKEAPAHLNSAGLFFFPVISFSNVDKILNIAKESFCHVEQLMHQEWPLPKEMYPHLSILRRLQEEGHIQIEEKFGMVIWSTDVYVAYNL